MKNQTNKTISIFEVSVLLLGIIAFAYLVGSEFKLVSAEDEKSAVDAVNSLGPSINSLTEAINNAEKSGTTPSTCSPPCNDKEVCDEKEKKCVPKGAETVVPTTPTPAPKQDWLSFGAQWLRDLTGGGIIQGQDSGSDVCGDEYQECVTNTCANKGGDKVATPMSADDYKACQENCRLTHCKKTLTGGKRFASKLLAAATWGLVVKGILELVAGQVKEHKGFYSSLGTALGAALPIGAAIGSLSGDALASSLIGSGVTIFASLFIFAAIYKENAEQKKTFVNVVWQAPLGGENCHLCNEMGILPCSEYQCRSLGKACQIVNPGTEEEMCFWVNRNDVKGPEIRPWDDALPADGLYSYVQAENVAPPDRGVKLVYGGSTAGSKPGKCLPPFTPISFGISTNEPASCKIDYKRSGNVTKPEEAFEGMEFYFGGSSLLRQNHTQVMNLPTAASLGDNLTYSNGGNFEMVVRCQDANGNTNVGEFLIQFCVDEGPDTTAPKIITTDPLSGLPIANNISTLDVNVYTNEKAVCKWSRFDQEYTKMNTTMYDPQVGGEKGEINGMNLYKHVAQLNGLKNDQENKFFFRCADMISPVPNKNTESYPFTLMGTKPLVITKSGPNGTIKDATDAVQVTLTAETFGGAQEGAATCYYKAGAQTETQFVQFFNTGQLQHSQDLFLTEGNYVYDIKCVDLGGNADRNQTKFTVDSDHTAPIITRLYYENNYLKVHTNEKAECVYDTVDCTYYYDEGNKFQDVDETTHFTDWNPESTYYVKCKDIYGNEPLPNKCSVIARPYEVFIPTEEVEE